MKDLAQQRLDKERNRTYTVTFPMQEMTPDQLNAWLKVVWGALSSSRDGNRMSQLLRTPQGLPTMVFEMWSDKGMKTPRLKMLPSMVEPLITQLQAHIPGIRVDKERKSPRRVWVKTVELRLRDRSRMLDITSAKAMSGAIATAFGPLNQNETMVMQWVIAATPRHVMPQHNETQSTDINARTLQKGNQATRDEVNDRRNKLAEPNFRATLRIAASAETEERADQLVRRLRDALAATNTAHNNFQKRLFFTKSQLQERMDRAAGSTSWPIQLTLSEFGSLIGWPLDGPAVVGFAPGRSSDLPPTEMTPRDGVVIGTSSYPGMEDRKIAIPWETTAMHTHVIGIIGTGKSELAGHICEQIADADHGLIVMETEGNLIDKVLDYMPRKRMNDVVLLDFSDMTAPVGFNLLGEGNPFQAVDGLIALMEHKYGRNGLGVWARDYLENGLRTLAEFPHLTFVDLATLINPQSEDEVHWADEVCRMVKDEEVKRFWARHENFNKNKQQERADPALSRLSSFLRSDLRFVFGQSKSAFTWREALRENKIILVNFKGVPKASAQLAGSMLMNSLWDAVKDARMDTPTHLVLDEFGDYMDLPIDVAQMMDQSRKHKFPMWLFHQRMNQLTQEVRDAVSSNARNKIAFEVGADSAAALRRMFGGNIAENFFLNIPAFEAIARIKTPTATAAPVTIRTMPPKNGTGIAAEIRRLNSARYGKPLAQVKREMEDRRKPSIFQKTDTGARIIVPDDIDF